MFEPNTSLSTTQNFFGLKMTIGPSEMFLLLIGIFALIAFFVIVKVIRDYF
jgi:hypothetical protein